MFRIKIPWQNSNFLFFYVDYAFLLIFNERERLPNVNLRSRSLFAVAHLSVCLSVDCLSSVTLVRPTQAVQIFVSISTALGTFAIR